MSPAHTQGEKARSGDERIPVRLITSASLLASTRTGANLSDSMESSSRELHFLSFFFFGLQLPRQEEGRTIADLSATQPTQKILSVSPRLSSETPHTFEVLVRRYTFYRSSSSSMNFDKNPTRKGE